MAISTPKYHQQSANTGVFFAKNIPLLTSAYKKNPDSENIAKIKVACKVDTLQLQNCGREPPPHP